MRYLLLLSCMPSLACAQQAVTLFGVADTYVAQVRADGLPAVSRADASGLLASRVGLRGREDLGGGLAANFLLEAGSTGRPGPGCPGRGASCAWDGRTRRSFT
jgi:predicted porin